MSNEIQVLDNGPILVKGEAIRLKDGAGNEFATEGKDMVALCRCGHSANKPFCDGAHAGKFDSETRAP
jgi:CDGSH-type Zn-finger protein